MRNLIIGSEGYIGSHLKHLIDAETIDLNGSPDKIYDIREHIDIDVVYDNVIFLAALVKVGESEEKAYDYYQTNVFGLINVLHSIKTKHFVFASSGTVVKPSSVYGISKKLGEGIVEEYCKINKVKYTIFRFYNVIGSLFGIDPTNVDGLFFNLIKAKKNGVFYIHGKDYDTKDGTAVRDYIHVYDVCNSIKKSLKKPANSIEELGSGKGYTVLEIVETFKKVNKTDFDIVFNERRLGDLEKSVLDNVSRYFKPKYKIKDMLKLEVDYGRK